VGTRAENLCRAEREQQQRRAVYLASDFMNALLTLLALALSAGVLVIVPKEGAEALVVCAVVAGVAALLIRRTGSNKHFLLRLFVGGLLIRVLVGAIIYGFRLQEFFGGDAYAYDL
jgi:hypothetical protein